MASFKVRRNLLARQSASVAENADAAQFNTPSGSVSTFAGGLTAASTVKLGSTGTGISHLVAGSLAVTIPALNASATDTVAGSIDALGINASLYKLIVTQVAGTACMVLMGYAASDTSPEGVITFTFFNAGGANDTNTTPASLHYIAIRDV